MQFTLEILRAAQADDPFAFRVGQQEYVLRTRLGGVETAVLDWDEAFLGELAALRLPGRDPELVQRVGDRLRRFLSTTRFSQREAELVAAVARGESVELTLRLAAAELYALPWELLTLGSGRHLGELAGVTLRYAWPETETAPEVPAPRPEGGRVLVAWSAAAGVVPAREHVLAIDRACRLGHHPFDPARDVLPHVTLERLCAALDAAERDGPVAVLHILCHGARHKTSFGLAWNREAAAPGGDGAREAGDGVHIVDAAQLRQLLQPHAGRLRLVVLCACDSANSGQLGSHLGSVAQALHRAGLAAVVASRWPLSSAGSVQLTEALYGALLGQPASLEAALGAARQRLRLHGLGSLDWASLQLYARPEDGDDSRPLVVRPYRGLSPFLMHHSRFFFGRERERQALRATLDKLAASGQPRLVVVAGASGSGKSSLVLGGLIPDLAAAAVPTGAARLIEARRVLGELVRLLGEHGSTGAMHTALGALQSELAALPEDSSGPWEWAVLRPGGDPLGALDRALRARRDPGRPFLLCVDQLEELFTHSADPAPRGEFARRLWALAREPLSASAGGASGVRVVLTLRVDFLGHLSELCLDEAGLRLDRIAYSEAHSLFVAQMTPEQLAAAIEGPAHRVGLVLPKALVQQMVRDVEGEPGALPLLEYVLDLLWQGRRGRVLTELTYSELGGVGGALGNSAERVLSGLGEAEQQLARRLLARLVSFGDGGGETRRRVSLRRLAEELPETDEPGPDPARGEMRRRLDTVLDAFVAARLLVRGEEQGEPTVEIAHEALIRKWPRLRIWLAEDRQRLEELRELEQWAAQFAAYGTVLRGTQLGYAQRLLDKYPGELGRAVTEMVRASVRAKHRRRQQTTALVLLVVTALSGLTLFARRSQQQALRERAAALHKERVASSRLLGIQAERALDQEPDLALILAARSLSLHTEVASRSVLATALERSRLIHRFLRGPRGRVYAVAWSPDGQRLAAASSDGLWLYDAASGALRARRTAADGTATPTAAGGGGGRDDGLLAAAWSPDGLLIAAAGSRGRVLLWDAGLPERPPERLTATARTLYSLDFSRGGELLAAGTEDGRVLLWDVARRQPRPPLAALTGQFVSALSFVPGPGAPRLAVAGSTGGVSIFDPATGQRLLGPLAADRGYTSGLSFSPDGRRLASASEDRTVLLWDGLGDGSAAGGPPRSQPLNGHDSAVSGVSFSPDGQVLVSCGLDSALYLWDVARGQPLGPPLRAPGEGIYSCAFSPDGTRLASGGDGQILIWDVADHPARRRLRRPLSVSALAVDPAGQRAAIGGPDGGIRLWDLSRPNPGAAVPVHTQSVNALSYDPSGTRLLSGGSDGEVVVLEAQTLAVQARLRAAGRGSVMAVAWSPRADTLAAGYTDGTLALFERTSAGARPAPRPPIASRQQSITALAFLGGDALLSSGLDGSLRLWQPSTGALRCSVASAHGDGISGLAVGQGGVLATGGRDQRVVLWRAPTAAEPGGCPQALAELPSPVPGDAAVTSLAFSRDGAALAVGTEEATVQLFEVAARQPVGGPLRGHLRPLTAVAFARDALLLTADDEMLRRWDLSEARGAARACARANRNLTAAEWALFFPDLPYCRICGSLPAEGATAAPACPDAVP